jgi:tetratricopeptide (TPR) repeat protein
MLSLSLSKARLGSVSKSPLQGISWVYKSPTTSTDPLRDTFQQLQRAEELRQKGQLDQARVICESLISRHPDYFGALLTLGLIYGDKQQYPQALGCLFRAAMINPENWRALTALSAVCLQLNASEMATHILEKAAAAEPQEPSIHFTLGEIHREEQEYALARDAYRKAVELDPGLEPAAVALGASCSNLGEYTEAATVFQNLIKRGTRSSVVLAELLNLPSALVTVDVLSELEKLTPDRNQNREEFENSIAFIRAAALDRAGRHEESWNQMVQANRALWPKMQRNAAELADTQRANLAQMRDKRINIFRRDGDETISLFILGPSRSGKSTMESLVATLDGVKRGYENPSVEKAIRRTFQSAGLLTSNLFEVLPPDLDPACREFYSKELARRGLSAKVFTNTHPGRIHDVARVAAAFPNVRFIFVKRNLEDNMIRIYLRRYETANPYAYDLRAIRDHIGWYHQMIDVLVEKIPDLVRVIHYEDMIADPLSALSSAADLCGLSVTAGALPNIGDDRDAAVPYRRFLTTF